MTLKPTCNETVEGVVTANKCECCGHHEIGVITDEGEYVALKPGMRVTVASQINRTANQSIDGSKC